MSKWFVQSKKADFGAMAAEYGIDQVIARILVNRDLYEKEEIEAFLHPSIAALHDGRLMKDMEKAVRLVEQAIRQERRIRIIGDYDIDGIQATYILHQALLRLGAKVDYSIPHRVTDGYGINPEMVEKCKEQGVEMIITCDNGIAAFEAAKKAKALGIDLIITDHHEVLKEAEGDQSEILPEAMAIVNPKQKDCKYPCKKICGAVVAWKLIDVLYATIGGPKDAVMAFLENAAFATVGDVMELVDENRTIVSLGLKALTQTKNLGMQTLIRRCNLAETKLSAYHVGFILGPCMNASGRLDSATKALELLETKEPDEAARLAENLQNLNEERKVLTQQGVDAGIAYVEEQGLIKDKVLVVYLPTLHESIAGIVAGRLREKYEHPVFVLVDSEEGNGIKGSGRSIDGYDMYEELCKSRTYLSKFGGHKMAAGLSLDKENLEAFRESINATCPLSLEEMVAKRFIDVPMPFSYLSAELIKELEILEPFGNGNAKPVFAQRDVRILRKQTIGKQGQYLKLKVMDTTGEQIEALYFGDKEVLEDIVEKRASFHMLYYPQINSYRGVENLQVVIQEVS